MIEEIGRFGLSLLCRNHNFTDDPYKVASLTISKGNHHDLYLSR